MNINQFTSKTDQLLGVQNDKVFRKNVITLFKDFTQVLIATIKSEKKVFDITGDDSTNEFTFTHDKGTKNFLSYIYNSVTDQTDTSIVVQHYENTIKVIFPSAFPPASGENYKLIVF